MATALGPELTGRGHGQGLLMSSMPQHSHGRSFGPVLLLGPLGTAPAEPHLVRQGPGRPAARQDLSGLCSKSLGSTKRPLR